MTTKNYICIQHKKQEKKTEKKKQTSARVRIPGARRKYTFLTGTHCKYDSSCSHTPEVVDKLLLSHTSTLSFRGAIIGPVQIGVEHDDGE